MKGLTTHVLDTLRGIPAEGVTICLSRVESDGKKIEIAEKKTDSNGRCEMAPELNTGKYELSFLIGDYFKSFPSHAVEPPFWDIVPVIFNVASPERHYHIPLVASPWSYSTYKGGAPKPEKNSQK